VFIFTQPYELKNKMKLIKSRATINILAER